MTLTKWLHRGDEQTGESTATADAKGSKDAKGVKATKKAKKLKVKKLTCSSCGANHLTRGDDGLWHCDYCGASYVIETDERTGKLRNATVSGNRQNVPTVFAVHGKLIVMGNRNEVSLLPPTKGIDAKHVRKLEVCGNRNEVRAILLDGASCEVEGNRNAVNSAR